MLLYSTKIPIKEQITQDDFVKLVIKWNQGSPHDKLSNLNWDGISRNIRIEENRRVLAISELGTHDIIASRFQKIDEHGIIWTTDFILNFRENKLSIQLEREATEETTVFTPRFTPPHLVKMVIRNEFIASDHDLPILDSPYRIHQDNYSIIENIILRKTKYALPVVYVTKLREGQYPINITKLARRLQGVAHVLIESETKVSKLLKEHCNNENVHHGGIGIYYPSISAKCKKINSQRYFGSEDALVEKIVNNIFRYSNQQIQEQMYTWEGIQNEILRVKNKQLLHEGKKIASENQDLYDIFGEQLTQQEKTIEKLNNRIASLEQENRGLRSKIDGMEEIPLLYFGEEEDLYPGEIREIILDILNSQLKNQKSKSRRSIIIQDILENNDFTHLAEKKKNEIKRILKGYTSLTNSLKQELQSFGFTISLDDRHHKLIFCGDPRYSAVMSKSGSEYRSGDNLSSEIIKSFL